MKYELTFRNNHGTDQELLNDMKTVAEKLGRDKLIMREYDELGKFSSVTIIKRFGSWNSALKKIGLEITVTQNATEKELFENLEEVWIKQGKQPQKRDMRRPLSKYSETSYITKFGSWKKGLEAFVEFINSATEETEENLGEDSSVELTNEAQTIFKHKTKRQPSDRLTLENLQILCSKHNLAKGNIEYPK